jgi:hypothetical protein
VYVCVFVCVLCARARARVCVFSSVCVYVCACRGERGYTYDDRIGVRLRLTCTRELIDKYTVDTLLHTQRY